MARKTDLTEQSARKIRLLLADDHPVVRKGIEACLCRYKHLEVVGEAACGGEALRKAKELNPDILLLDIGLPDMDGVAVTEQLKREVPNTKVIVLTMRRNVETLQRLVHAGIRGYLLKDATPDEIINAIEAVYAGDVSFSPDVAKMALQQYVTTGGHPTASPIEKLTEREREGLKLIAEGCSNKDVARALNLSVRTVETHRERIMRKLQVHNAAGLTKIAIAHGLVRIDKAESD
ncbi:MAG: response regulator transcription factor [Verrucomicrobiae bacterium]|nr:response regulator transcription factor [Verrucomicrobiae bacterium]